MATVNVYEQYFGAECEYNGVLRHAALVKLVSDSENGDIRYSASVTFFPHNSDDDFAVSYDAYFDTVLFEGKGRRSRKREQQLLAMLPNSIDTIVEQANAKVFWDRAIREAKYC